MVCLLGWLVNGPVGRWMGDSPTHTHTRTRGTDARPPPPPNPQSFFPKTNHGKALALAAAAVSPTPDAQQHVVKLLYWRARALERESFYDVALADAKVNESCDGGGGGFGGRRERFPCGAGGRQGKKNACEDLD